MSIARYLRKDGWEALLATGWPPPPDQIELPIRRDHLRKWLAKRGVFVDAPGTPGKSKWRVSRVGGKVLYAKTFICQSGWDPYKSYDDALIVAVQAVLKEEAEEKTT
jgi:hypothetical protein